MPDSAQYVNNITHYNMLVNYSSSSFNCSHIPANTLLNKLSSSIYIPTICSFLVGLLFEIIIFCCLEGKNINNPAKHCFSLLLDFIAYSE